MLRLLILAGVLACLSPSADAHASLVQPVPRNSNDRDVPLWRNGSSPSTPCTCANGVGGSQAAEHDGCDVGTLKRNSGRGQACLWCVTQRSLDWPVPTATNLALFSID